MLYRCKAKSTAWNACVLSFLSLVVDTAQGQTKKGLYGET